MSSNNFFLHLHFCMILLCKERERNKYQTNLFWRVAKEATFEPFHFNFAIFEAQYLSMGWRIQTFFYLIGLCIIHFLPSCLFNQNGEKEYTAREREQKKKWKRSVILSVTRFFNLPIWAWASSNYSMKMNRKKIVFCLLVLRFFSPCIEFLALFHFHP